MSSTSSYCVSNQLRRYKRLPVFGAGLVTTLMLLVAFALAMLSAVRAHVAAERRTFVVDHDRVMQQIRAGEASFRIGLVDAELARPNAATGDQALVVRIRQSGHHREGEIRVRSALPLAIGAF